MRAFPPIKKRRRPSGTDFSVEQSCSQQQGPVGFSISRAGAGSRGLAAFKIRNGTLEPWNPGTLEPWNPGTLNPGTLNLGTLEPWNPGPWNPGP